MPLTSTLAWPDDLPDWARVDGFQESGPEGAADFAVEDGPSKRRPRVSAIATYVDYSVEMTLEQWGILKRFYDVDTARGSLTFAKRDVVSGEQFDYRFRSRPKTSALGGNYLLASLSLTTVP